MSTAHKLSNNGLKVDNEWLRTKLLSDLPEQYEPMMMAVGSSGIPITTDVMKAKVHQDVKDENDIKAFTANIGSQSSYAAVFIACQNVKDDKSWFVDSGAPCHMTKHEEWLQEVMTPPINTIKVANNDILHVKSCGHVSLDVLDEKGQKNKVMCKNVLYVPELATNVLSVSQIIKSGGQVKFNGEGCVILNKLNTVVATASLVNNMYRLSTAEAHAYISEVDKQDAYVWHQRMGHLNFRDLEKLNDCTEGAVFRKQVDVSCLTCLEGKQTRLPFNHEGTRVTQLLELVHFDLCGPMETTSLGGASYFLTLTDDFSRKVFVYALRSKEEVLEKFKEFRNESENLLKRKIKCLCTENGTELVNKEFSRYLKGAGIIHQTSVPYTAQQKGLAERINRMLVEKAKCMLLNAKLHKHFWAEALLTAAHVYNRSPSQTLSFKTPEEVWKGTKPNVSHLRIFGCEAMVHAPKEKAKKSVAKARKMIFIGYCEHTKSYRFIIPNTRTVVKNRDAVFIESSVERNCVPVKLTEPSNEIDSIDESCSETSTSMTVRKIDSADETDYLSAESFDSPPRMVVRSRNQTSSSKTNRKEGISYLSVEEESVSKTPAACNEAATSTDAEKWKMTIDDELEAHHWNESRNLVKRPVNLKIVGCKWVFPSKDDPSGLRSKAILSTRGYLEKAGIDYNETFSPTVRYDFIRLLLSIDIQQNNHITQIEVKTAFPYGVLQERIFTSTVLGGLKAESNVVCKVVKSLYGLKQPPSCWKEKFDFFLKMYGFIKRHVDQCVLNVGLYKKVKCYLLIYVDNRLLFAQEKQILDDISNDLRPNFEITTCEPMNYVGMQLDICKNVNQLLNNSNMTDANPNSVPADPHLQLEKCEALSDTDIRYREAVGFLTHAVTVSRPDTMFAVSLVSRFLNNYYESGWNVIKKTSKYLKVTKSYELCYQRTEIDDLVGYSDAYTYYASYVKSRRFVYDRGKNVWPPAPLLRD